MQQQAAAQQTRAVPAASQTHGETSPRISVLDTLEGMKVVSVDSWGIVSNVVLHDPKTGQYHTTALDDRVLGWV